MVNLSFLDLPQSASNTESRLYHWILKAAQQNCRWFADKLKFIKNIGLTCAYV